MASSLTSPILPVAASRVGHTSTEEFINLIIERPALWQKWHPEFTNRAVRNMLLAEVSCLANMNVVDCSRKLKRLKDSMRQQVAKLSKTKSGLPDFKSTHMITWPYFSQMLCMKDEFINTKKNQLYFEVDQSQSDDNETTDISKESSVVDDSDELSSDQGACPCTHEGSASSQNRSQRNKRRHPQSSHKQETVRDTDEFDVFAFDIANDLKKINSQVNLLCAKSKIRRIVEEFVMSELLATQSESYSSKSGDSKHIHE